MKIRIASWNMHFGFSRRLNNAAWEYLLNQVQPDFFLFQEGKPPVEMQDAEHLVWAEIGGTRKWGSGVYSPGYELREESIETSFRGAISIANATVESGEIALISMYGLMELSGPTKGYAIPNLHRMLSDLTGLFNGHIRGKRNIIMAGDLNASTQIDVQQRNRSHEILFDRIRDFRLQDVYELSGNKSHVQTLRHARSATPWQNDYCFISKSIAAGFVGYQIIDDEEVQRFSDHNILVVEMNL